MSDTERLIKFMIEEALHAEDERESWFRETGKELVRLDALSARLTAEIERKDEALLSIANNTCCEPCQEARLVALNALSAGEGQECKDYHCKQCGNTTGRPCSKCVHCGAPVESGRDVMSTAEFRAGLFQLADNRIEKNIARRLTVAYDEVDESAKRDCSDMLRDDLAENRRADRGQKT